MTRLQLATFAPVMNRARLPFASLGRNWASARTLGTFHIKSSKEFHGTTFRDNEVSFVYLYARPVDAANLTLQAEEVERVDWFDLSAVRDACLRNDPRFCVSAGDLELLSGALSAEA